MSKIRSIILSTDEISSSASGTRPSLRYVFACLALFLLPVARFQTVFQYRFAIMLIFSGSVNSSVKSAGSSVSPSNPVLLSLRPGSLERLQGRAFLSSLAMELPFSFFLLVAMGRLLFPVENRSSFRRQTYYGFRYGINYVKCHNIYS